MLTDFSFGNGGMIQRALRFAPSLMPALALAIACEAAVTYGKHRPADEDWHAHMFQLLLMLQLPAMLYLVVIHRRTLMKLMPEFALQLGLWLAAFGVVQFFSY